MDTLALQVLSNNPTDNSTSSNQDNLQVSEIQQRAKLEKTENLMEFVKTLESLYIKMVESGR